MKRFFTIFASLFCCLTIATGSALAQPGEAQWPKRLVISVPASGNVVHMIVSAIAKTIEKNTPVQRVIVQPIGGPASWLPKMEKGEVDLAVHAGPDTVELIQGIGAWEKTGAKPFLRTVLAGNRNLFGVITVPGKGIESWSDLRGKVVFLRQPGNPLFDRVGTAILESAGLKESDLKAAMTMINFREASADILEGRVDAAISTGSGPFMLELEQAAGKNMVISPNAQEAEILMRKLPTGFFLAPLKAHTPYFNNSTDLERAIMYRNAIYARADMHPDIAYAIIKAVDEHRDEWEQASPVAPDWATPYEYAPPYHEGVVKYYQEKGAWEGPVVENHERLLQVIGAKK